VRSAVDVVGLCGVLEFVRGSRHGRLPEAVKQKTDLVEDFLVVNVSRCAAAPDALCAAESCRKGLSLTPTTGSNPQPDATGRSRGRSR
jgi:hypothetical protein